MMKYSLIIIIIFLSISVNAQVIDRNDIYNFAGAYEITNIDNRHSSLRDNSDRMTIDNRKLIDWKIIKKKKFLTNKYQLDNNTATDSTFHIRRDLGFIDLKDRTKHWVAYGYRVPHSNPSVIRNVYSDMGRLDKINYEFYTMTDQRGFESMRNALTIWKKIGEDSLEYLSCQFQHFTVSMGRSVIEYITILPDSSFLLAVKYGGGDAGDFWGGYKFFKETIPLVFEPFYDVNYSFTDRDSSFYNYYYTFDQVTGGSFTISEIKEYYHYSEYELANAGSFYSTKIVDSVDVELIDLWQMAQDSLK